MNPDCLHVHLRCTSRAKHDRHAARLVDLGEFSLRFRSARRAFSDLCLGPSAAPRLCRGHMGGRDRVKPLAPALTADGGHPVRPDARHRAVTERHRRAGFVASKRLNREGGGGRARPGRRRRASAPERSSLRHRSRAKGSLSSSSTGSVCSTLIPSAANERSVVPRVGRPAANDTAAIRRRRVARHLRGQGSRLGPVDPEPTTWNRCTSPSRRGLRNCRSFGERGPFRVEARRTLRRRRGARTR